MLVTDPNNYFLKLQILEPRPESSWIVELRSEGQNLKNISEPIF